jgi:hypothetical protein
MDRDEEHLKILSICHYVYAGVLALFSFLPLFYAGLGLVFVNLPPPRALRPGEPNPAMFGYIFVGLGLFGAVLVWSLAACVVAAGRFLSAGRNRVFCIVVAGFSCLHMPFGTVLGVFTLIVLSRRSVADYFARGGKQDVLPTESAIAERGGAYDEPHGAITTSPPIYADEQTFADRDAEHLKILSICHYVFAGLLGLASFGPLFYVGMGVVLLNLPPPTRQQPGEPGPEVIGYFIIAIGLFLAVLFWGLAACLVAAGRFLRAGRNRVFCMIVAGFSCMQVPLGSVLGVFTLIVLSRPSVIELFSHSRARDVLPAD